jgi:hypothetical protein
MGLFEGESGVPERGVFCVIPATGVRSRRGCLLARKQRGAGLAKLGDIEQAFAAARREAAVHGHAEASRAASTLSSGGSLQIGKTA